MIGSITYLAIVFSMVVLISSCSTAIPLSHVTMSPIKEPQSLQENIDVPLADKIQDNIVAEDISTEDTVLQEVIISKENIRNVDKAANVGADEMIENELIRILNEFGSETDEVPPVFLKEVTLYIRLFQTVPQYKKFVTASLKRSGKYMSAVKEILAEKNIPEDMAYIAFIESGFSPDAVSPKGAKGLWQFMPKTARDYGLTVSKSTDDRLDPIKSTYAAAEHFKNLIAIFGPHSFLLAMAAYNGGEGKIIGTLKKLENPFEERNFWKARAFLPLETREFPPKIIAAAIIGNNPEAFGFAAPNQNNDESESLIANYRQGKFKTVPASFKEQPHNVGETKVIKTSTKAAYKNAKPRQVVFTVKKGNTLINIATHFKVDINEVKQWNHMKSNKVLAGQKLKIYTKNDIRVVSYTVKKGDTITQISDKFNVVKRDILFWNGLDTKGKVVIGQTLVFYKTSGKRASA